jgi:hypothetical protein
MAAIDENSGPEKVAELSVLDSILVAVRVIGSVGAGAVIVIGVVLAIQLFSLIQEIIKAPEPILQGWQQAMAHEVKEMHLDDGQGAARMVEEAPAKNSDVTDDSEPDAPAVVDTTNEEEQLEDGKADSPNESAEDERRRKRPTIVDEEIPAYIGIVDRILEQLENGEFGWLAGMAMLALFCWFLVKIPTMLITLGSRLLLGLVNVGSDG